MKTITWSEIIDNIQQRELCIVLYSNRLLELLKLHGFKCGGLPTNDSNYIFIYNNFEYGIYTNCSKEFVYTFIEEPSVPDLLDTVLHEFFKACRNH